MFTEINKLPYFEHNLFKKHICRFIELLHKLHGFDGLIDPYELISIEEDIKYVPEIYIACSQIIFKFQRGYEYVMYWNYLSKDDSISILLESGTESFIYHFRLDDLFDETDKKKYLKAIENNFNIDIDLACAVIDSMLFHLQSELNIEKLTGALKD